MSGAWSGLNLVETLGWPLLHFVWQGVLIASLCALGCALLRNARPQSRYALACLALGLCLLWPAYGVWQQITAPASLSLEAALALLGDALSNNVTDILLQEESGLAQTMHAYLPLIVATWLLGVTIMLARMALGWLWLRQIGSGILNLEQRALTLQWQARTSKLAQDFGLQRRVELRVDARLQTPVTTGCWRPVIVLPLALLSGMSPALLDALLAHELAHIKRWDYAVNLLQNLVLSLLFYHPAVWWIARRIDLEREQIADDMASSVLGKPRDLALALQKLDHFQLIQRSNELALAASGKASGQATGQLLARIRRLLRPAAQVWRWHMAAPLLGVCMAAALLFLYQRHAPQALANELHSGLEQLRAFSSLKTNSQHVLVMDEGNGQVLLEKNADAAVPVASLSKLMTAMVTLDAGLDMQEAITITAGDVPSSKFAQSRLTPGVSLPRRAVLDLMLIPSDNSAAKALARTYPGGEAGFKTALQNKVKSLELKHSFFEEASGISVHNTSSASDLHKLAAAAASYPEIAQLTTTSESSMRIAGKQVEYQNSNPLIAKTGWDILLAKTGFSRSAGRCLIMRMKVGGRTVSVVLLNAKDSALRDEDVINIRHMLEQRPAVLPGSTSPLAQL